MKRKSLPAAKPGRVSVVAAAHKVTKDNARVAKDMQKQAQRVVDKMTSDSFQNFLLSVGIGTDNAMSASTYGFNPITRQRIILEWIHRGSWIGGVAIDLLADDMTRAGVEQKGELEPDQMQNIEELITTLGCWDAVNDTVRWSRLYGGAISVFLIDGQKMNTPFRLESVGKGQFKGLIVMDRWMIQPSLSELVTEPGPHMGMPKFYHVVADAPALIGEKIHYTRCLRLEGIRLPYYQRLMENLWGISVIERLYDRLVAFDAATQGASQLIHKSYLRTLKLADLRTALAAGGKAEQGVVKQVSMMRRMQQNEGISVIDAHDEFQLDQSSGYSGISDMMLRFGEQLSGALQIPLVRLFGQSPAGLSATGESDLRNYYDGIKQQQNRHLKVDLTKLYRAAARSLGIETPKGYAIEFRSLWQMSEKERSETAQTVATAVDTALAAGVIDKPTAMKELRQSSEITGIFSNISEEDIAKAEEEALLEPVPEPEAAEGAAGASGPGRRAAEAVQKAEGTAPAEGEKSVQPTKPGKAPSKGGKETPGTPATKQKQPESEPQEDAAGKVYGIYHHARGYFIMRKDRTGSPVGPIKHLADAVAKRAKMIREGKDAQTKAEKTTVDYSVGKPNAHCGPDGEFGPSGACANFIEPTTCRKVAGTIKPDCWCKLWEKKLALDRQFQIGGLDVVIETKKGELRSPYNAVMPADYGYIRNSGSAEGSAEQMDCFLGDDYRANTVWIVHQKNLKTGEFDEHKILLGFPSAAVATDCYVTSFNDGKGRDRIMRIDEMSMSKFKDWLKDFPYSLQEANA